MSIKHALLALLAAEPTHGYDLKKQFDEKLGVLWPLKSAQVYNNLRILEQGGLIELDAHIEQADLPDRKNFRLTAAGERALHDWVTSPLRSNRKLKDEFYLKLTTLAKVLHDPDALLALLWKQREVYLQHVRELEQTLAEMEAHGDEVTAALLEGAILHAEADLVWLDRVEERLQQMDWRDDTPQNTTPQNATERAEADQDKADPNAGGGA